MTMPIAPPPRKKKKDGVGGDDDGSAVLVVPPSSKIKLMLKKKKKRDSNISSGQQLGVLPRQTVDAIAAASALFVRNFARDVAAAAAAAATSDRSGVLTLRDIRRAVASVGVVGNNDDDGKNSSCYIRFVADAASPGVLDGIRESDSIPSSSAQSASNYQHKKRKRTPASSEAQNKKNKKKATPKRPAAAAAAAAAAQLADESKNLQREPLLSSLSPHQEIVPDEEDYD